VTVWVFADIEDSDDAGVGEASRGPSFEKEALAEFLLSFEVVDKERDGFDGDQAIDLRITSLVNDAHGTTAEFT
jgi:hypothetical protein